MKKVFAIVFLVFLSANLFAQTPKDYTRYVNPFVGTGGHGHTFPGATVPFGFVQLSPDTRMDDWDGSSGYHYSDKQIYGFSHTHLSGTGIPDYCDILFAPTLGEPELFAAKGDLGENGYASTFSHQNEKAEAGYYSVKLDEGNILAEMTATARVGFHRYTFPANSEANLILDLKHRDKVLDSELRIVGREPHRRLSPLELVGKRPDCLFRRRIFRAVRRLRRFDGRRPRPKKANKSKGKNIKAFFRFAARRSAARQSGDFAGRHQRRAPEFDDRDSALGF